MPQALLDIRTYINSIDDDITLEDFKSLSFVSKREILESKDVNLSLSRYQKTQIISKFGSVSIKDIASVESGNSAPQNKKYFEDGTIPFIRTSDVGKLKFSDNLINTRDYVNVKCLNEKRLKIFNENTILLPKSGASTYLNHRVMMGVKGVVASHLAAIVPKENLIIPKLLLYLLTKVDAKDLVNSSYPSLKKELIEEIKIPLPPLEIQKEIVEELEQYQKVIDGAKQVVDNYKPHFEIDENWHQIKIENVGVVNNSTYKHFEDKEEYIYIDVSSVGKGNGIIDQSNIIRSSDLPSRAKRKIKKGSIIISSVRPNLKGFSIIDFDPENHVVSTGFMILDVNESFDNRFIYYSFFTKSVMNQMIAKMGKGSYPSINQADFMELSIYIPEIEHQVKIADRLDLENSAVQSNKKLIEIYSKKIEDRINKIWGD